jgi:hypothetical protein
LIGGYNQLVEYLANKKLVNYQGEVIDEWIWKSYTFPYRKNC